MSMSIVTADSPCVRTAYSVNVQRTSAPDLMRCDIYSRGKWENASPGAIVGQIMVDG